jgi:hormone-sensitive lipase
VDNNLSLTSFWYYFKLYIDLKPKKIILVGDSAGGNLVAALTNLLIKLNARIPDGIVLVYPALNLNYNFYTPSLLSSLECLILPHTFLKICLESYIQDAELKPT